MTDVKRTKTRVIKPPEPLQQDSNASPSPSPHKRRRRRTQHGTTDGNNDFCTLCRGGGELLCCDTCPNAYHLACLKMSAEEVPEGLWSCPECRSKGKGSVTQIFNTIPTHAAAEEARKQKHTPEDSPDREEMERAARMLVENRRREELTAEQRQWLEGFSMFQEEVRCRLLETNPALGVDGDPSRPGGALYWLRRALPPALWGRPLETFLGGTRALQQGVLSPLFDQFLAWQRLMEIQAEAFSMTSALGYPYAGPSTSPTPQVIRPSYAPPWMESPDTRTHNLMHMYHSQAQTPMPSAMQQSPQGGAGQQEHPQRQEKAPLLAWLTFTKDPTRVGFEIRKNRTVLGRGSSADINMKGLTRAAAISKAHAIITYDPPPKDRFIITNLGKNGTRVDGVDLISEAHLASSMTVEIGGTEFTFHVCSKEALPSGRKETTCV